MGLWLNDNELIELTGKKHRHLQLEVIKEMFPPIVFRLRPDGFILVDRWQFLGPVSEPSVSVSGEPADDEPL